MRFIRSTSLLVLAALLSATASAQRGSAGVRVKRLPEPQSNLYPAGSGANSPRAESMAAGNRPAIMLTGYWPPTGTMLREFSTNPSQNPGVWIGSDWEGRGYDVYSYFAEYTGGGGQGSGDLEVDYQDTTADFWPIAAAIQPIAIITFSMSPAFSDWEVERVNKNHAHWVDDFTAPFNPTPEPPDASVPVGHVRYSTLPMQDVVDAIDVMNLNNTTAWIDMGGGGGGYLSEFIGYHGVWYQSQHFNMSDPAWCVAAGHLHVGGGNHLFRAKKVSKQVLRAVIRHVDQIIGVSGGRTEWFCPTTTNSETSGAVLTARGSYSLSQNDLELYTLLTPSNEFGIAFCGANQTTGSPFGDGQLCVQGPHYRFGPPVLSNDQNELFFPLDSTQQPNGFSQITPGSTWNFQLWYRDGASVGAGHNLSSALGITFAP
jgi:hypothetical protein